MKAEIQPDPFGPLAFDIRSLVRLPTEIPRSQPPPRSGRFAIGTRASSPPPILDDEKLDGWFR